MLLLLWLLLLMAIVVVLTTTTATIATVIANTGHGVRLLCVHGLWMVVLLGHWLRLHLLLWVHLVVVLCGIVVLLSVLVLWLWLLLCRVDWAVVRLLLLRMLHLWLVHGLCLVRVLVVTVGRVPVLEWVAQMHFRVLHVVWLLCGIIVVVGHGLGTRHSLVVVVGHWTVVARGSRVWDGIVLFIRPTPLRHLYTMSLLRLLLLLVMMDAMHRERVLQFSFVASIGRTLVVGGHLGR